MNIEQKIGQMMMIGWQSSDYRDIIELIKDYHFGNIILFTRNIKSSIELKIICEQIQQAAIKYNGVEAFIAIDQEGGSVRRIYDGVSRVSGLMAIGAASARIPEASKIIAEIVGEELKKLGVNFNLSPVADINTDPQNPVIAIRSFGDNPDEVSRLASLYAVGLQEKNVLACYKHFIGHGDVNVDSHLDLPYLLKSYEEIRKCELIPYMTKQLPDAIMTAHILYKAIDDKFPASISYKIINNILREELKYQGIVLTDCFEMDALSRTFSLGQAACFAVKAGTDIVTVSHTFGRQMIVRNALLEAVANNSISMETIDKSVNRILALKDKYCPHEEPVVDYEKNQQEAKRISKASITLASGKIFEIDEDTVVVGVTNYINSVAEDINVENMDIAKILGETFRLNYRSIDNKNFNINETLSFCGSKKVILALSDSHLTLVQKVLYASLQQNKNRIMLISIRTPYDVLGQENPECHVCIYEYTKMAIESLIEVLKGDIPHGRLPVKIVNKRGELDSNGFLIDHIVKYINENFAKNISLESLSDKFLVSSGYISKLFKKKMDLNFIDYVNHVRIVEAKKLLSTTPLKIYEVANVCGYKDINYFTKIFKGNIGVTPTYYKNNNNDININN